jgi:hypothetical protein
VRSSLNLLAAFFAFSPLLMAQRGSDALGCAACSTVIAIPIVFIILNIALLISVARDAKARGMDNSVLWMLLVMFTSFVGLIIYRFSRPQGILVRCPNCNNQRLQMLLTCPHCGSGPQSLPVQNPTY